MPRSVRSSTSPVSPRIRRLPGSRAMGRSRSPGKTGLRSIGGAVLSLLLVTAPALQARADDITGQINEALSAYARKDIPTAIAGLEAALNMLRQSRADLYGAL